MTRLHQFWLFFLSVLFNVPWQTVRGCSVMLMVYDKTTPFWFFFPPILLNVTRQTIRGCSRHFFLSALLNVTWQTVRGCSIMIAVKTRLHCWLWCFLPNTDFMVYLIASCEFRILKEKYWKKKIKIDWFKREREKKKLIIKDNYLVWLGLCSWTGCEH